MGVYELIVSVFGMYLGEHGASPPKMTGSVYATKICNQNPKNDVPIPVAPGDIDMDPGDIDPPIEPPDDPPIP